MPVPDPSDKGNTGRPPSRDELREGNDANTPAPAAHSYDQSATLPVDENLASGETAAPARPIAGARGRVARVEDEHDTIEDLADEPLMDGDDSDSENGPTRGEHLDGDADAPASLGDGPISPDDDGW